MFCPDQLPCKSNVLRIRTLSWHFSTGGVRDKTITNPVYIAPNSSKHISSYVFGTIGGTHLNILVERFYCEEL